MLKRSCAALSILGAMAVLGSMPAIAKTTISLMGWTNSKEDDMFYKEIIAAFEKANPQIAVANRVVAWTGIPGYLSKILVQASAGVAADVIACPMAAFPSLAANRMLVDLGPYAKSGKVATGAWQPASIEACTLGGKLWGLPFFGGDWWITYNRRAFKQAGVADPEDIYAAGKWDMDTMLELAQKTTKFDGTKSKTMGILTFYSIEALNPWALSQGASFLDSDGNTCTMGAPSFYRAMDFVNELIDKRKVLAFSGWAPFNVPLADKQDRWAMAAWWSTVPSYLRANKVGWEMNMLPFPSAGDRKNNSAEFNPVGVFAGSKKKDAALKLVQFMAGPQSAQILANHVILTGRKDSLEYYKKKLVDMGLTGNKYIADAQERLVIMPRSSRANTVFPIILDGLMKGFSKKSTMAQAIDATVKLVTTDLKRGRK